MTGSESDGPQPPSRKRSRASANADDGAGGKKARGRPRVDTQDETAADRRRTQIRLAQRAYRQRKETTIASLKDQNGRLQSIIEQMNKSFLRFNDSALKSGLLQLNPSLSQELKQVTETFVTLAKTASESNSEEDELGDGMVDQAGENQSAAVPAESSTQASQRRSKMPQPQHMDVGWGYTAMLTESPSHSNSASPPEEAPRASHLFPPMPNSPFEKANQSSLVRTRRPVSVGHVLDQSTSWGSNDPHDSSQLPFGLIDILSHHQTPFSPPDAHIFNVNIPTPKISPPLTRLPTPPYLPSLSTKTLKPTWTYSHDETTFARRLTRASLETGFHLLSAGKMRPAALNYVFKLSLPYLSLNDIRERFKIMLARGTDEDLDMGGTPFIHLGGAGTHYPRRDVQGNIIPIPNAWTVRRIGPITSKMMRAENTADPSQSHDLNIDLTGFEGEWFDAHDVEGYLQEEKGCHINPQDSFAEVQIEVDDEPLPSESEDYLFASRALKLNYSHTPSDTPSFSSGSITASSTNTTPTETANTTSTNNTSTMDLFGHSHSDAPFGLDMGIPSLPSSFSNTSFNKYPDIDSTLFDQPLGLDLAPAFSSDFAANNTSLATLPFSPDNIDAALGLDVMANSTIPPPPPPPPPPPQTVGQKRKRPAWIDVSKLIDEIIKHGVCLGRAPGFRRKDVDMAFNASLITAF